jgi:amidase
MPVSADITTMSAVDMARHVRRREVSPVELVEAATYGIVARNPSINAMIYSGFDDAIERAKEVERQVMSGATLGPFHGVPTAKKDCGDFKPGRRTTFGGRSPVSSFTLTDPLDAAWVDDARVYHGATAIRAIDPSRPSFRDVLVITFRRQ